MINSKKLKAKVVEKGFTIKELSKKIDLSNYTLGQKISNKSIMNISEAKKIIDILDIKSDEIEKIFFI